MKLSAIIQVLSIHPNFLSFLKNIKGEIDFFFSKSIKQLGKNILSLDWITLLYNNKIYGSFASKICKLHLE